MAGDCRWRHPRAPALRKLWKEGVTEAVLGYLGDTLVGSPTGDWARQGIEESRAASEREAVSEGEEGGPGPP